MGLDQAKGALLGAAVGDAVGAYLEFWGGDITEAEVDHALTLPGGGCFVVGPGQFTDDTELALCQAHGLAGHPPSQGFPANSVARQYTWWYNVSRPFDVGNATATAFDLPQLSPEQLEAFDFATATRSNVQNELSLSSKANGALMRATPLAIWAHRLGADEAAAAAAADAGLSHPSQTCQDASAAYILAIGSLIRQPGDAAAALAAAEGWAAAHACDEVQGWLAAARDDEAMAGYDAGHLIGFVKHAFLLAFYHLRRGSGYAEGLRHVLLAGGDTDTNAAIMGGVLGALHGASGIPSDMQQTVEHFNNPSSSTASTSPAAASDGSAPKGHLRPEKLRGFQLPLLAERLYEEAVKDAEATAAGGQAAG